MGDLYLEPHRHHRRPRHSLRRQHRIRRLRDAGVLRAPPFYGLSDDCHVRPSHFPSAPGRSPLSVAMVRPRIDLLVSVDFFHRRPALVGNARARRAPSTRSPGGTRITSAPSSWALPGWRRLSISSPNSSAARCIAITSPRWPSGRWRFSAVGAEFPRALPCPPGSSAWAWSGTVMTAIPLLAVAANFYRNRPPRPQHPRCQPHLALHLRRADFLVHRRRAADRRRRCPTSAPSPVSPGSVRPNRNCSVAAFSP